MKLNRKRETNYSILCLTERVTTCRCRLGKFFFYHNFSGGLSQDFAGSGQDRVTAKKRVRAGSSHSAEHNITVSKIK